MRTQELFDLTGKVAIVTGGGGGLGVQIVEALADCGASVIICSRNLDRCERTAEQIASAIPATLIPMECDVRDAEAIQRVVATAISKLGGIDILVNNAGTSWGAPLESYPLSGWQKVIDVNLTGTFHFTQIAGRAMIERGEGGKIVNLASVTAFRGAEPEHLDAVAYHASKGGVVAFTRDVAVKWARHRINVNAIAPGWFPTEMSQVVLQRSNGEFLRRIPLQRYGGADDLKGAIVFLASSASDFVTGHTLMVDGGQSVT